MNAKINFEFSKTKISKLTKEYLVDKMGQIEADPDLTDSLNSALEGKHIKVKEANLLIQSILAAINFEDTTEEDEDEKIEEKKQDTITPLTQDQTLSQQINMDLLAGTSNKKDAMVVPITNNKSTNKPLCKFYAKGNCRHKELYFASKVNV